MPEQPGHSHADVSGGWLRAAVFGAMDGLVSNLSLIAGVGGGGVSSRTVVLAGVAGLLSGAISMALGEFTSVRTQNEQLTAELAKEAAELEHHPDDERRELIERMTARGLSTELAERVAEEISARPALALRIHAVEELGVVPDHLPSPWVAAGSSFVCFALGAVVPLAPYLLGAETLLPALFAGAAGLFAAGALASWATSRSWVFGGVRQLVLGLAAAGVTYGIGVLIGVNVG